MSVLLNSVDLELRLFGRLEQIFLDVDELASDLKNQLQYLYGESLGSSEDTERSEAVKRLEAIYKLLHSSKQEYREFYTLGN